MQQGETFLQMQWRQETYDIDSLGKLICNQDI